MPRAVLPPVNVLCTRTCVKNNNTMAFPVCSGGDELGKTLKTMFRRLKTSPTKAAAASGAVRFPPKSLLTVCDNKRVPTTDAHNTTISSYGLVTN